jgi:polyisoprenoid-binding protein YceI
MIKSRTGTRYALAAAAPIAFLLALTSARAAFAFTIHYRMDPTTSVITAAVSEPIATMGGDAEGTFKIIDGEIFLDPDHPASGKVELLIDATSYHSDKQRRDHDVTMNTLETDTYPTIRFNSTSLAEVSQTSATDGSATVNGDLTLHGRTLPVSVPVNVEITTDHSKAVAEGQVQLKYPDWGVKVPTMMFLHAGDEATLSFHIAATRVAD